MQTDVYCEPAAQFVRLVRTRRDQLAHGPALRGRSAAAEYALDLLDMWDCELTADSAAGALYEVTLYFAMQRLFKPWLAEWTEPFIGVGFHRLLHPLSGAYVDRAYLIAMRILENEETEWMRDAAGHPQTSAQILDGALADALGLLEQELGGEMQTWTWGRLHRAAFKHPLGSVKPLDKIFNRGPFPYGGDTSTVWQAAFVPTMPISDDAGFTASWRQIIDLHDWDASRAIHPTGQSGHPASRHYADMMALWLRGEYHPMWWTRDRILANKEGVLILEPA
jgi:penicillin amidase